MFIQAGSKQRLLCESVAADKPAGLSFTGLVVFFAYSMAMSFEHDMLVGGS